MIDRTRRNFVLGAAATGFVLAGCRRSAMTRAEAPEGEGVEAEVTPSEDLMREHGALNRILLIYEEGARRLAAAEPFPLEVITRSADIVRRFIEEYHEKLEENYVFPRFERAGKLVDLVAILRRQHQAGRALTTSILRAAGAATAQSASGQELARALQLFAHMYRPHEAREDTVVFPALRSVVGPRELEALGEQFEDREHELFGKAGFEGVVAQIAELEQAIGIYDLDQFTPI